MQLASTQKRLAWLTLLRVFLAFVLLASALIFDLTSAYGVPQLAQTLLYHATGAMVLLSLLFSYLIENSKNERVLTAMGLLQVCLDAIFTSVLVISTGGIESIFTFFFSLFIISASIALYRMGALVSAFASSACFFLILLVQFGAFGSPGALGELLVLVDPRSEAARAISLNFATNIVAFFAIAFLASFLVEQLREADSRIEAQRVNIRELRNLYENIISSLENGLITVDPQHQITFANEYSARWVGVDSEAMTGQPVSAFFPDLWPILSNPDKLGRSHTETTIRAQDERIRHFRWTVNPLRDSDDQLLGRVLLFWDITELKEMESRMERADRMATIGRLAANIAHEIRNPLASMSGSIQLLSSLMHLDGDERRLMDIVMREAEHLNRWITEFLSFSRPVDPSPEPLDLALLCRELVELAEHDNRGGNLQLTLITHGDTNLRADAKTLRQILWNLLNNALDASSAGGTVTVELDGTQPSVVTIAVQDEGEGIPEENRERIFDPFFSTKEMGTGLGLATVQRNVELHGGRIKLQSSPGNGARFEVLLPRKLPSRRSHGSDTRS